MIELDIMEQYGLTPSEYFVCKLIFMTQEGYKELYLLRYRRVNKDTFRDDLMSLQDKGVILKSWKIPEKGSKFDPLEIPLNKNFFKNMFKSSLELGKQLFDAYPMFVNINGSTFSLRSFAKKFDSIEDFFRFYGKTIHWDLDLHNKILELIKCLYVTVFLYLLVNTSYSSCIIYSVHTMLMAYTLYFWVFKLDL